MIHKSSIDSRLLIVKKTLTQSVNNSVALVDDNALTYTMPANSCWEWKSMLLLNTSATADIRLNMVAPGSDVCTVYIDPLGNVRTYGTNYFVAGMGASQIWWHHGIVNLVGAGGVFKLQWAQQVAEVSNTTIYYGSYMILHRLW
jgi:hypothetical protein